jgi:hypothetical protein
MGRRKSVGGQEDLIEEVALEMQLRGTTGAQPPNRAAAC